MSYCLLQVEVDRSLVYDLVSPSPVTQVTSWYPVSAALHY